MSVSQGIGTSVPEKLEKGGGGHMMFLVKGGPVNGEVEKFKRG